MNIKGQINGIEIDIRKPDPAKLVKDGVWYEIIAYRCPEAKETSYSSVNEKIQTWFARPMFEIGYWILHPIPRPTPEWLKATGYTASEMPEEYKVGDVIFSDHFATSSVIEKSKTHRRRYLLTSKLFEPEKKTPKQPAQPEPAAPDSHADLRQHCFECAKFLDCDHYCAPTAGCFVAMEPPAPDISKGVWFQLYGNNSWHTTIEAFPPDSLIAVMAAGEKFVREKKQPDISEDEALVRRLAKWSRTFDKYRFRSVSEFQAIEDEAVRLHPETKGE